MSDKDVKPTLVKKKQKPKPTHPSTSEMVTTAIKVLKSRRGSSLYAIKKFIAENYVVKMNKLAPFIKSFLRNAVKNGILILMRGKGASGSFKLSKYLGRPVKVVKKKNVKLEAGTSRKAVKKGLQKNVKVSKKKFSGADVKNEPVKEEIKVEPDLMYEEDEDESEDEEGFVVKEERWMDEECDEEEEEDEEEDPQGEEIVVKVEPNLTDEDDDNSQEEDSMVKVKEEPVVKVEKSQ